MSNRSVNETKRRRLARARREKVKDRARTKMAEVGEPAAPLAVALVDPNPILIKDVAGGKYIDTGVYEPIFIPRFDHVNAPGRHPIHGILLQLRRALAVQTLMTYHGLKATPGTETTTAALDALASANPPVGAKRLLKEGRRLLAAETMFGSERELREYSATKYARLRRMPGQLSANSAAERAAAELSAVELISIAYRRAQSILSAFEEAHAAESKRKATPKDSEDARQIRPVAHEILQRAFDRNGSNLNVGKLFELAILADINPATLWPQHIRLFAQPFELARFIGRIDRGLEARLDPRHVRLLAAFLQGNGPYHDERDLLGAVVRERFAFYPEFGPLPPIVEAVEAAPTEGARLS